MAIVEPSAAAGTQKRKYESPRQLERRVAILTATREMLAEEGYAATTMRSLAGRAKVAPGTLYNLYSSKDELMMAAVEEVLDGLVTRAIEQSTPGLDRLLVLSETRAANIVNHPEYAEAMARALFRAEPDDPLTSLLYARSLPLYVYQIEVAIADGDLAEGSDADKLSRHLQAQQWGVIMAWVMGIFELADVAKEYTRSQIMVLLSVATAKGKRRLNECAENL